MEHSKKVSGEDILDAIAHVGVAVKKIEDAQHLLEHITEDFFGEYDPNKEEHRHYIAYHFEYFASYARILGVCLEDLHSTISKADDVFFNVNALEVTSAIENGGQLPAPVDTCTASG